MASIKQIAALYISLIFLTCPIHASENSPNRTVQQKRIGDAREFVALLVKQDFTGAIARFDTVMKRALPEPKLQDTWRTLIGQVGQFKEVLGTRTMQQAGYDVVFVTSEFERSVLDVKVVYNTVGQIAGLFFVPGKRPSQETKEEGGPPKTVREIEVQIGEGKRALPGVLAIPATDTGPWPAVVLVHGSGPQDRDETVGMNKPFRDLAWGLAAKGIAVLRYDKATKVHPDRFRDMPNLTVKEEVVDDAIAAVARLRATAGIATNRIFVLGHSLGGLVAPRIAQADPGVAGIIIMAGATRPIEDLMLEQTRHILSLDGELSADDKTKLADLQSQVAVVKNITNTTSPTSVLGAPPSYWLDLRHYDAPATAAMLKQRILILQGGRDYQVTLSDFNGWQNTLKTKSNVTSKFYPDLNHLFVPGEGKSTPAEYEQPGHVASNVIADIANWINAE